MSIPKDWVEQVQDASPYDLRCEGICSDYPSALSVRKAFIKLWDSIYSEPNLIWESNPWVWGYKFELLGKPLSADALYCLTKPVAMYKYLLTDNSGEYIRSDSFWLDVFIGAAQDDGTALWRSGHSNKMGDYGKTWVVLPLTTLP